MAGIDFSVHLPLLRIEQELVPFAGAQLYRMPFDRYDEISLGAFSEQRARYERTEPVFLSFSITVPDTVLGRRTEDGNRVFELKVPSTRTEMLHELGLGVVNWVHDNVVTPAWSGLLLAAPACAFAPPRWSQTFIGVDEGYTLLLAGGAAIGARVQGQADHEYLFFPEAASEPLTNDDLVLAAELAEAVIEWERMPVLHAALSTLRATGIPVLSRQDRLTIAVQALESLLLPEVRTQLKKTFARRVAALLATDAISFEKLGEIAAALYSLRSASIHGSSLPDDGEALQQSLAEQLLARAIRAMAPMLSAGETVESVRARLDLGFTASAQSLHASAGHRPTRRSSDHRLSRPTPSDVFAGNSAMAALRDHMCLWSPLLGLTTEKLDDVGAMLIGARPSPVLMPLSPQELLDLEERDIRRDYLMEFVQQGHSMAVLMTIPEAEGIVGAFAARALLERMQDLGVVALRFAGYDDFHDPELFGSTIFEWKRRLRWPTVVRQTVAERLRHEAVQTVGLKQQPQLAALWNDLWSYESGGRSREIEYALGLFRRSFDREFLEPDQRAVILVSVLESMLGRFRASNESLQLEDLVAALLGTGDDIGWFRSDGRNFRNQVAHGEFVNSDQTSKHVEMLSRLVSRVLLELIRTWNDAAPEQRQQRPASLLIQRASKLV